MESVTDWEKLYLKIGRIVPQEIQPGNVSRIVQEKFYNHEAMEAVKEVIGDHLYIAPGSKTIPSDKLLKFFSSFNKIGEPSTYGTVMAASIERKDGEVIHGPIPMDVGQGELPHPGFAIKTFNPEVLNSERNFIHELFVGSFCLNHLRSECSNFIYTFGSFSATRGIVEPRITDEYIGTGPLVYKPNLNHIILENIEGPQGGNTLQSFLREADINIEMRQRSLISIIIQVIKALSLASNKYMFIHGDLHMNNILIRRLPDYTYVKAGNIALYTNVVPVIIDYGYSSVVIERNRYHVTDIENHPYLDAQQFLFEIYSYLRDNSRHQLNEVTVEAIGHLFRSIYPEIRNEDVPGYYETYHNFVRNYRDDPAAHPLNVNMLNYDHERLINLLISDGRFSIYTTDLNNPILPKLNIVSIDPVTCDLRLRMESGHSRCQSREEVKEKITKIEEGLNLSSLDGIVNKINQGMPYAIIIERMNVGINKHKLSMTTGIEINNLFDVSQANIVRATETIDINNILLLAIKAIEALRQINYRIALSRQDNFNVELVDHTGRLATDRRIIKGLLNLTNTRINDEIPNVATQEKMRLQYDSVRASYNALVDEIANLSDNINVILRQM